MRFLLPMALVLLAAPTFAQEKLTGSNVDVRIAMTFKVSEAALRKLVPDGWEISPATSGPNQGANLSMTMVNQSMSFDPDGKPLNPFRGVAFSVPMKRKGSDATVAMIIAGIFTPNGAPGAYGLYLPAQVTIDRKLRTEMDGKITVEESWDLRAGGGNSLLIQVHYVPGPATRGKVEARVHSALKPDFFRVYRFEAANDVVRSVPAGIDRASVVAVKASGDKLGTLFDGSQQVISVTSIPWYSRQVYVLGL
ncbi:MAG TPA: hypothetical protein VEQ87_12785 [Burkholderiales bacterium]|nr:hypothetical protein [Burkholderiales bacterium]